MEDLTKHPALGPYELSQELYYLTPPPFRSTSPAGRVRCGRPEPGTVAGVLAHSAAGGSEGRSSISIKGPLNGEAAPATGRTPPGPPAGWPCSAVAGARTAPKLLVEAQRFANGSVSGPSDLPKELHYLTPPPLWWTGGAGCRERGQPEPGTVAWCAGARRSRGEPEAFEHPRRRSLELGNGPSRRWDAAGATRGGVVRCGGVRPHCGASYRRGWTAAGQAQAAGPGPGGHPDAAVQPPN